MPAHTRRFKTYFLVQISKQRSKHPHRTLSFSSERREEPTVVVTRFFFSPLSPLSLFWCEKRKEKKKGVGFFPLLLPGPPLGCSHERSLPRTQKRERCEKSEDQRFLLFFAIAMKLTRRSKTLSFFATAMIHRRASSITLGRKRAKRFVRKGTTLF